MKRSILFILTLIAASALVAGDCQHGKAQDQAKKDDCCAWKKDAKIEVVNLDNGAKVTISAEKAEVVKSIQDQFAQMAKGGCKHGKEEAKAKEEAKPADAKGGCMHGKDEAKKDDCCAWKKDAKIDVANQAKGVVVTITTEKKDDVKAIQEHAAMMGKSGCMHGDAEAKAGCKHGEGEGMAMAWKKDAKFEVANLDNGGKMTVTSEKPEAVKAIQEHFASMGKDCPMKDKMAWHKDAKIAVVNEPKGAVLTITTEKKDDVKAIQEHLAMMSKGDCCKGMKDQEKAKGGCMHGQEKAAEQPKV